VIDEVTKKFELDLAKLVEEKELEIETMVKELDILKTDIGKSSSHTETL